MADHAGGHGIFKPVLVAFLFGFGAAIQDSAWTQIRVWIKEAIKADAVGALGMDLFGMSLCYMAAVVVYASWVKGGSPRKNVGVW